MKNIKITLMLLLLVSLVLFALTSCEVVDKVTGMITGGDKQPEHTHSFGEATCVSPATCECGATDGEALGHSIVVDKGTAPTCTESGLADGEHCERCDYKVDKAPIDAKGHTYISYVVSASCTESGYTFHTCRNCGDTYTENETEPVGHTYIPVVIEPTCTVAGNTHYTCYACADSYVGDEVAALGHSHEVVVTAPTCNEAGYTTYTCACGDTYTADEVAALGHSHEIVVTAPTCTEAGYTTYTCACGDSYTADETAALGHSHEAVVTAPTCTEAGYTTYTCACGDSYTADEVAAPGHNYVDGKCECGANENGASTPLSNAVLDCTTKDNRVSFSTEQQIWQQNGITLTLNRGEGTAYSDKAPITFGSKGSLTIEAAGMKTIVIQTGNTTYGTYVSNCFNGQPGVASVSAKSGVVTIVFTEVIDVFNIDYLAKQGQIKSITVNPES